jgi:hypothetical protein
MCRTRLLLVEEFLLAYLVFRFSFFFELRLPSSSSFLPSFPAFNLPGCPMTSCHHHHHHHRHNNAALAVAAAATTLVPSRLSWMPTSFLAVPLQTLLPVLRLLLQPLL